MPNYYYNSLPNASWAWQSNGCSFTLIQLTVLFSTASNFQWRRVFCGRCTWCSSAICRRPTWRQVLWGPRRNFDEPSDISSALPTSVRPDASTPRQWRPWSGLAAAWRTFSRLATGRHRRPSTTADIVIDTGTSGQGTVRHRSMRLDRPSGTRRLSRTGIGQTEMRMIKRCSNLIITIDQKMILCFQNKSFKNMFLCFYCC